ncbi:MAG: hypothetical protein IT487_06415 [Chromatiaceae bacterium]|nr:hypothetical protein [Chromatiaceae bacterium]
MPFVKGQSGNPAGRKPKSDSETALRQRIRSASPRIVDALVQAAESGDVQAGKALLSFVLPAWRPVDRPLSIDLGDDLSGAVKGLVDALRGGELAPSAIGAISSVIATMSRVSETAELEKRLIALENQLAQPNE